MGADVTACAVHVQRLAAQLYNTGSSAHPSSQGGTHDNGLVCDQDDVGPSGKGATENRCEDASSAADAQRRAAAAASKAKALAAMKVVLV